jgi:hypothetical protein
MGEARPEDDGGLIRHHGQPLREFVRHQEVATAQLERGKHKEKRSVNRVGRDSGPREAGTAKEQQFYFREYIQSKGK